jgi:hypothetical protein
MGKYFAWKPCFHRLWGCHRSAQSLALEVHALRQGARSQALQLRL